MLPATTYFSCSQPKPLQLCSLSWGNTLRGKAKVSWNAACRQGCCCKGKRQFIPVKLIGFAHTSLTGSNWLQRAHLACHVGWSCLTMQQSDVGALAKPSLARVALPAPESSLRHRAPAMGSAGRVAKTLFYEKSQVFQGWSCFGRG